MLGMRTQARIELPSWESYCAKTTKANALVFDLGNGLRVWFSYKTPVAFSRDYATPVVRENVWGPTTGKHLNAIDDGDKGSRVRGEHFEALLAEALGGAS